MKNIFPHEQIQIKEISPYEYIRTADDCPEDVLFGEITSISPLINTYGNVLLIASTQDELIGGK